jgi:NAD(P)-dependent dehydrogenase (short-subunit alcohol dehydrogenase family)
MKMAATKTAIVTGASQGIGTGLVNAFIDRGYNVVATSRNLSRYGVFYDSDHLAVVDGDISHEETAIRIADTAQNRFGTIDALVNNAGVFLMKPFADYSAADFRRMSAVNVEGFLHLTKLTVKAMQEQKSGGSIVSITGSLADSPIAGITASVAMISKGGINAVTRNLAMEFARDNIRVNAVSPGFVDTPRFEYEGKDFLKTLSPIGTICGVQEIADAVVFLTEAPHITGEVLHVDGGAHLGKW